MPSMLFIPFSSSNEAAVAQTFMADFAAGATAVVPGPAAGFVRVFDRVQFFPNAAASPLSAVTAVLRDASLVDWFAGSALGAATVSSLVAGLSPLVEGESFRLTNGSANAGRVVTTYVDEPAARFTMVRMALSNVFQDVIPAAPLGSISRIWTKFEQPGTQGLDNARMVLSNDDTVSHTVDWTIGADLFSRSSATAAAVVSSSIGNSFRTCVTSSPMRARVAVSPVTRPPLLLGAYETIPL